MFLILLKFAHNKSNAGQFMEGHKQWIQRGFADEVFLVVGSLQPNPGGAIMAHNSTLEALQKRLNDDPFVAENVVTAEVLEISSNQTDACLDFLLG